MFERYAIYITASGSFAQSGAAWLGWDIEAGCIVAHPNLPNIDLQTLTEKPRKYGFHATIKPPFVLAKGESEATLKAAVKDICTSLDAGSLQSLEVAALGRFLALIPQGDTTELNALAETIVRSTDRFRMPMSDEEMKCRGNANLNPTQRENLCNWGYPHVMDQFRFHMTLTGRMPKSEIAQAQLVASEYFSAHTNVPLPIDSLTLVGQGADGYFVEIERFPLRTISR